MFKFLEKRLIRKKVNQFLDFNNAWYKNPTAENQLLSFVPSENDQMKVQWKIKDIVYSLFLGDKILNIIHKGKKYQFVFPDDTFKQITERNILHYFAECAKVNSEITYRYQNIGIQTKVGDSNVILRLRLQENQPIEYVFSYVQANKKYSSSKETATQEFIIDRNIKADSLFFQLLRTALGIDKFYTDYLYGYYENECEFPEPNDTLIERNGQSIIKYQFSKFFEKDGKSVVFIKGKSSIYENSEVLFKLRDRVILDNTNNLKLHENLYDEKFEFMAGKTFEIQSFNGRFVNCIEILDEKLLGEASIHNKKYYVFNLESIKIV